MSSSSLAFNLSSKICCKFIILRGRPTLSRKSEAARFTFRAGRLGNSMISMNFVDLLANHFSDGKCQVSIFQKCFKFLYLGSRARLKFIRFSFANRGQSKLFNLQQNSEIKSPGAFLLSKYHKESKAFFPPIDENALSYFH